MLLEAAIQFSFHLFTALDFRTATQCGRSSQIPQDFDLLAKNLANSVIRICIQIGVETIDIQINLDCVVPNGPNASYYVRWTNSSFTQTHTHTHTPPRILNGLSPQIAYLTKFMAENRIDTAPVLFRLLDYY